LVNELGAIGNLPGGLGTVIVTGPGSSWTNIGTVVVGGLGAGALIIQNGGAVNSQGGGSIGLAAGSTGTVTVTGPGSAWTNTPGGGLNIGSFGTGTLMIANGGRVINITPAAANIGNSAGSQGTVTVTGAGSRWSNNHGVNIGLLGTGALTVADGGVVQGPVLIATTADARGTLNIGAGADAPAAAPGTLTAPSIIFGAGTGTINFNHTSADYVFAPAISGGGTVNVLAGTTILTADNSYTGGTTISGGTLAVGDFAHPFAALSGGGPITVGSGGTLGGYGIVTGLVTNSGVIAPGSATPGFSGSPMGAFTINGNYAGSSGTLAINTFLGGDNSPSDRLVISGGAATGNTIMHVTNVGGPGAETTGDGIQVVSAVGGAATAPGAFALPAGELRAGAFDYDLFRGGLGAGSANDWFLRSDFVVPLVPIGPSLPSNPSVPLVPLGPSLGAARAAWSLAAIHAATGSAAAWRSLPNHWAGTRHLWGGAASCAAIGAQHPRHARRPKGRHLRAGRLRRSACGRDLVCRSADQEVSGSADPEGAGAGSLPVVCADSVGALLRPNDP
jgi:T5SS/PEP-CTERM-associated repeat protein/autotransporter-associated beta strand protein